MKCLLPRLVTFRKDHWCLIPCGTFDATDVCTPLSEQIRLVISKCERNTAFPKKSEKKI